MGELRSAGLRIRHADLVSHPELVHTIAVLNLLLERWCEPPVMGRLHLLTLVQQFLSLIAQHGGVRADQAFQVLCQTGAFANVDATLFAKLLRCLGTLDILTDYYGTVMH